MVHVTERTARPGALREDLEHVVSGTAALWDELRGRRLFITGGTGFLGRWLLESFVFANDTLALDAEAVVLTRDPHSFAARAPHLAGHRSLQLVTGDVRSFAFPEGSFSHIIHAAAESSHELYDRDPLAAFDAIAAGMRRVLDFAAAAGASVLFLSSGAVYGKQPPQVTHLPESYGGAPELDDRYASYSEGKRVAELIANIYGRTQGVETKIARCFTVFGPFMPLDRHFAIGNFLRDALRGASVTVQGDGTPFRSYLYAADLAIWLWTILLRGAPGRPYNVGSDASLQIADVARCVAEAGGTEVVIRGTPDPSRPSQRYVPDITRARQELALTVAIPLREGVARTYRYLKELEQYES